MARPKARPETELVPDLYADRGYASRADYLEGLALENGVALEGVLAIAEMMGEDEDFDGLVPFIEDHVALIAAAYGAAA